MTKACLSSSGAFSGLRPGPASSRSTSLASLSFLWYVLVRCIFIAAPASEQALAGVGGNVLHNVTTDTGKTLLPGIRAPGATHLPPGASSKPSWQLDTPTLDLCPAATGQAWGWLRHCSRQQRPPSCSGQFCAAAWSWGRT